MGRLLLIIALLCPVLAQAGRPCEDVRPQPASFVKAMDLAQQAQQALEQSGAQVALIARAGQDLSKYGLRYSHMGVVWRDHPKGRWLVVHELNNCGTADSSLFNEGLGNFFLDDMFSYDSVILVPDAATQAKMAQALSNHLSLALHEPHYNMVAYAYSTKYQNSNQWLLEMYAVSASAEPIFTRTQAQRWLKRNGYQPITLDIPALTRLGGRMFRANIAFDDHPFDRRMAGQIDTVTVDSVLRFVHQRDRTASEITLSAR